MVETRILTPRGVTLAGTFVSPVDSVDAAVLFSHSFLADRHSAEHFDRLARQYRAAGYATLEFDYSGHGQSGDEIITLDAEVEDLRAASGWLADQGYSRQIVHAHSFGASVALTARPKAVLTYILSSPRIGPMSVDWRQIFSEDQLADLEQIGATTIPDDSASMRRQFTISKQTLADLSMGDANKLLDGLDKPTLIMLTSVIGKYAPKQGTPDVHGAPLGADGVKAAKEAIGLPSDKDFYVLPEAYDYFAAKKTVYAEREAEWKKEFEAWSEENPELRKEWDAFHTDSPTDDVPDVSFKVGDSLATRDASGKAIVMIAKRYGNFVGGSADLTGPNKTKIDDLDGVYSSENRKGRMIEFGIREFAMSAISAGISLHGGLRPFCATFLVFSDYLRPSLRVASLMKQPVIYVFTHDSIYVGEDGPTHQPVETLASLRAIPGVQVLRPGDAEETVEAWKMAYESKDHPVCLALTRQKLAVYEKADKDWKKTIRTGAYVVQEGSASPDITVLASGSEVNTALEAAKLVPEKKIRIVSVIDLKRFSEADDAARNKIIGSAKRIVAAEAGIGTEWFRFVKDRSDIFSIETFGESGPAEKVAEHLHFTAADLAKVLKR